MAALIEQVLPEGVALEFLDEVTSELRAEENRPMGLFIHTHFTRNGRTHTLTFGSPQRPKNRSGRSVSCPRC